jgi:hypothetical protein
LTGNSSRIKKVAKNVLFRKAKVGMTINSVAMEIVEAGYSNASLRYNSLLKG